MPIDIAPSGIVSFTFLWFIFAQILNAFCLVLLSTNKTLSDPSHFLRSCYYSVYTKLKMANIGVILGKNTYQVLRLSPVYEFYKELPIKMMTQPVETCYCAMEAHGNMIQSIFRALSLEHSYNPTILCFSAVLRSCRKKKCLRFPYSH